MKSLFLLLTLLTIASTLIAQEESSSFRLELSSQAIHSIKLENKDDISRDPSGWNETVEDIFNYAIHLSGFWDVNQRMELGVGLGYSNRDANFRYGCDFCFTIGDIGRGGYRRRRAIEVPIELRLNWYKEDKKVDPFVSFGINNSLPILYFYDEGEQKSQLDFTRYSLGLSFALGTRVQLSKKWSLVTSASIIRNSSFLINADEFLPTEPGELSSFLEWSGKFGVRRSF